MKALKRIDSPDSDPVFGRVCERPFYATSEVYVSESQRPELFLDGQSYNLLPYQKRIKDHEKFYAEWELVNVSLSIIR